MATSFFGGAFFGGEFFNQAGAAVVAEAAGVNGDGGLGVWDMWSARSSKYPGNREVASHWRSFRSGGGITIATLFGMAKSAGWKPPSRELPPIRTAVTIEHDKPREPTIIDTKAPLNTARQFVAERFNNGDVNTLHYWRGDW